MNFLSKRIISIRNGQKASRRQVVCCISKSVGASVVREGGFNLLVSSLELLRREGYIRAFKFTTVKQPVKSAHSDTKTETRSLYLTIYLKYDSIGNGAIRSIFLAATPARRVYLSARSFWQPQTTSGILVLSTSQGIMTDVEARRRNLGGELLFGVI